MTANELSKIQKEIEADIVSFAKVNHLSNNDVEPILDGVVNPSSYCKASKKILWVLKEPYDDVDDSNKPVGGGWSIISLIKNNPKKMALSGQVFKRIAYITYGILNNIKWQNMDYINKNSKIAKALESIAYVNVGKMPNFTTTTDSHLKDIYKTWKDILLKQIKSYEPDVIIFGNTFSLFANEFFPSGVPSHKTIKRADGDYVGVYNVNGKTLLDAYHPSAIVSDDSYVETILEAF